MYGLTTPVEVDYLGVHDPKPSLLDEVERQGGELQDVDEETADYEGEHEAKNHHFLTLHALHKFLKHLTEAGGKGPVRGERRRSEDSGTTYYCTITSACRCMCKIARSASGCGLYLQCTCA